MPAEACNPSGEMIRRNPGVSLLWHCGGYELFRDSRGGVLFQIGEPTSVDFYAEGRQAKRSEIMHSIDTGLPILKRMAKQEGKSAFRELTHRVSRALKLVPTR